MLLARQDVALCLFKSYSSQHLLRSINYKPLPFLARALRNKSKAITDDHKKNAPRANPVLYLNPPESTLPPPLILPTSKPNLPLTKKIKHYYRTGKAYLTFYKTGVKALWHNYKVLRQLRTRIPKGESAEQALRAELLSRAEYHLYRRTKKDASRIPIFALVLTICGEFTPIVVLFLGLNGAVPTVCHIPKQVDGARKKAEERRQKSFREGTISSAEDTNNVEDMKRLPRPVMLHVARSLGLYSPLWDKIRIPPTILLPRRIQKAVERIDVDDIALEKGGGVQHLNKKELRLAAEERGLDVLNKPSKEVKVVLGQWRNARKLTSIIDLLCRRPSVWPREEKIEKNKKGKKKKGSKKKGKARG
ncbi:MAG: hypothetical protein Q9221_005567 [Calogaya cf. arnoldii]